jgi:hypothetical protein
MLPSAEEVAPEIWMPRMGVSAETAVRRQDPGQGADRHRYVMSSLLAGACNIL